MITGKYDTITLMYEFDADTFTKIGLSNDNLACANTTLAQYLTDLFNKSINGRVFKRERELIKLNDEYLTVYYTFDKNNRRLEVTVGWYIYKNE